MPNFDCPSARENMCPRRASLVFGDREEIKSDLANSSTFEISGIAMTEISRGSGEAMRFFSRQRLQWVLVDPSLHSPRLDFHEDERTAPRRDYVDFVGMRSPVFTKNLVTASSEIPMCGRFTAPSSGARPFSPVKSAGGARHEHFFFRGRGAWRRPLHDSRDTGNCRGHAMDGAVEGSVKGRPVGLTGAGSAAP